MYLNNLRIGFLIIAGALLSYSAPGSARAAQESPPAQAEPDASRGPDLHLSADQIAQREKIRADAKAQMEIVKSDTLLSADQKQAKLQQIRRDAHRQEIATLTPEQKKELREWHRTHRSERRQQSQQPPSN